MTRRYIALAEALDAPLVTRDSALASARHRARRGRLSASRPDRSRPHEL